MKLLIKNDLGQHFEYTCDQYEGYDVFCEANYQWGPHGWETFTVQDGEKVLMNVINPNVLDPSSAQTIQ
jgi:hypothetical protein